MELNNQLKWRYATKKFDPNKKVSAEQLEQLKEAIQLSASSYGLQSYKILIIENKATREALQAASWGQAQIVDASHLFIFCHDKTVGPEAVDTYLQNVANTRALDITSLAGYGDFMKMKIAEKSAEEVVNWTARQTYIALGNLLAACAELKIDSCPMEGFDPSEYDKILNLSAQNLSAAVVATIGYRSEEDQTQYYPKVRKSLEDLFEVR